MPTLWLPFQPPLLEARGHPGVRATEQGERRSVCGGPWPVEAALVLLLAGLTSVFFLSRRSSLRRQTWGEREPLFCKTSSSLRLGRGGSRSQGINLGGSPCSRPAGLLEKLLPGSLKPSYMFVMSSASDDHPHALLDFCLKGKPYSQFLFLRILSLLPQTPPRLTSFLSL